jgi:RHS repeat-associated protein
MIWITRKLSLTLAPLLLLLTSSQITSAWYDPSLQRWISREPLGEAGFEATRGGFPFQAAAGQNLYQFVYNKPGGYIDSDGLGAIAFPLGGAVIIENPIGGALCVGAGTGAILCWAFPEAMTKPGEWIANLVCPVTVVPFKRAKKECIAECTEKTLPTGTYDGAPFFKCMRECMRRKGHPNY